MTDLPEAENQVLVFQNTVMQTTMLREGMPAPWAAEETIESMRLDIGIRESGAFALSANTSGPADADEFLIVHNAPQYTILAREGLPAPVKGEVWGGVLARPNITFAGDVAFCGVETTGPLRDGFDGFCMRGSTILQQEGSVPLGQTPPHRPWQRFSPSDFNLSQGGSTYLIKGDLTGDINDDVLVVNGTVRLQEGSVVPNSGFSSPISADATGIASPTMDGPNWMCRGRNADSREWVVRNGEVVAQNGAPISAGSGECWKQPDADPTFLIHEVTPLGHWIVGGLTDGPRESNGVVVYKDVAIVLREGDPIDLNGDDVFNDNVFLDAIKPDHAFLGHYLQLHAIALLRNAAGSRVGEAYVHVNISQLVCPAEVSGDFTVDVTDILFVISAWGPCDDCIFDINSDSVVNVTDLLAVISSWGACP